MRKSILAVDVELHMVKLLENIIRDKSKHKITTTHNALELPALLDEEAFDIVISELHMPGYTGFDLLNKIRSENRKEVVIIMTSKNDIQEIAEAFRLGASDVIVKPFKSSRLFEAIERAIVVNEQICNARHLADLLATEPLEMAAEAFKKCYIRCLFERCERDAGRTADKAGITRQEVDSIIKGTTAK